MRIVSRVGGAMAILLAVTGCAIATHTTATASTTLPTCAKTLLELSNLSTSLPTKRHIPLADSGPMHFCRYRWNATENKLALMADDTELKAPIALLMELSKLKTMNEVYGPNVVFLCPLTQGNADLIILRAATGSTLTAIEVQRGGCGRVIVTHPGSTSYIAYVSTAQLIAQLDVITPTGGRPNENQVKIQVTPSINLRDGQKVLVKVSGASPGERFWISECASASATNKFGCGDQMALQPFIDTDPSGSGSTTLYVHTKAATKPYNTADIQPCARKCVIMATGTNFNEQSTVVYAPVRFHP